MKVSIIEMNKARDRWNEIARQVRQDEPGRFVPEFDEVGYHPEIEEGKVAI